MLSKNEIAKNTPFMKNKKIIFHVYVLCHKSMKTFHQIERVGLQSISSSTIPSRSTSYRLLAVCWSEKVIAATEVDFENIFKYYLVPELSKLLLSLYSLHLEVGVSR